MRHDKKIVRYFHLPQKMKQPNNKINKNRLFWKRDSLSVEGIRYNKFLTILTNQLMQKEERR